MYTTKSLFALGVLGLSISATTSAEGWTQWATPTQIDVVGNLAGEAPKGLMLYGAFGATTGAVVNQVADLCSTPDRVFIPAEHVQYKEILSAVLSANISGRRIRVYVTTCAPHVWYSPLSVTYGFVGVNHPVNVGN